MALVAAGSAACGLTAGGRVGDVQVTGSATCGNVPSNVCDEQMKVAVNAAGPPIESVDVICTGECTRAGGAGTTTIRRPDGSQVVRAWTYVGDPGPVPVPVCVGMALDVCQFQVNGDVGSVTVAKHLVGIKATCQGTCDRSSGTMVIQYTFADGTTESTTTSWQGPAGVRP